MTEDVTAQHLFYFGARLPLGGKITATESALLAKLPERLELEYVSKPLLYARELRELARSKTAKAALRKLIQRGKIRVERNFASGHESLVKTSANPRRKIRKNNGKSVANPKRGVMIYPRVVAIYAEKPNGKRYRHEMESIVPILGLPDGSLLIPAKGRRLWGTA